MSHLSNAELHRIVDRLVLCSIQNDRDAFAYLAREVGECARCWRMVSIDLGARLARVIEAGFDDDRELAALEFTKEALAKWPKP